MPLQNRFAHQAYPTTPVIPPKFCGLNISDGADTNYERLHTELKIAHVIIVHGTFMGNDSFGVADILEGLGESVPASKKLLDSLLGSLRERMKAAADKVAGDLGNYAQAFRDRFQALVGEDPSVSLLDPPWSGQNHHLARADLAMRLICRLDELQPGNDRKVLLWGHSHAGNGFALLTNLLANDRDSVKRFFLAAGSKMPEHWRRAKEILATGESPHSLAQSVSIAAFGTPVRYGWDSSGYQRLIHVLHHRNYDNAKPTLTKPLFPPHSINDTLSARYGDWVQAFAIAGTDVPPPTWIEQNKALTELLEATLPEPMHDLDTRFILPQRVRDACARWKTGTRCHADGKNLLVEYQSSGLETPLHNPIEEAILGHGVATSVAWLPTHLTLIINQLSEPDTPG